LLCITDKPFELIDSMHASVAKQKKNVTQDLSLIVIEGYIAMINSTDKISTRVSCSMWSFFSCLIDVIELRHKLVCFFDVSR
jgi:hypothetical protein